MAMPAIRTELLPKSKGALRVLHTADWHFGKMLGDLSRQEEHTRFLSWLLDVLVKEKVDVLLIAGDIFDTANPPQAAERMYFEFLASVYRATKCCVVITGGNHDSPAHLEAPGRVLRTLNVHVVGALPDDIGDLIVPVPTNKDPQLLIAAVPFLRDRDLRTGAFGQTADDIREELREGIEAVYQRAADACSDSGVAMLAAGHLTVAGARVSDSERDVHVGGLGKVDHKIFPEVFDYVALGHLHRPQSMGTEAIRYSGSPIPLSFSECEDEKEVRLLDFEGGELTGNQSLPIPFTRRLMQVKTSRLELESVLSQLTVEKGALPTWVEITVETQNSSENLFELARSLTEDRLDDFEIVRVQARRHREATALSEKDSAGFEDVDTLLDSPREVFERRLAVSGEMSDEDMKQMRVAFDELYGLYLEERKGEEPEPEEQPLDESTVPLAAEADQELLFDFGREDEP